MRVTRVITDPAISISLAEFYKENGYPLSPDALANLPNGREHQALVKKCCHLIQGAGEVMEGIDEITFEILGCAQFNAWAAKLDAGYYYIAISRGLMDTVLQTARAPEMRSAFVACTGQGQPAQFTQFVDCAQYGIYCTLLFHEMGHIVRGHLDLPRSYGRSGYIDEVLAASASATGYENVESKAIESDADCCSARLLIDSIHEMAQGMDEHYHMGKAASLGYAFAIAGVSAAWTFGQMSIGERSHPDYPSPTTRHTLFLEHLIDQLQREKAWDDETAAAMREGRILWEELADALKLQRHSDPEGRARWEKTVRPAVIALERILPRYTPCRKKRKPGFLAACWSHIRVMVATLLGRRSVGTKPLNPAGTSVDTTR